MNAVGQAAEGILERLDAVFEAEEWFVPLRTAVGGLTAQQAAWRPSPGRHNIWEIVNHLALWTEYVTELLAGKPRRPKGWAKEADWVLIPTGTPAAWNASVQRLLDAHAALKAEFSTKTDDELKRPFGDGQSPLSEFERIAGHDAYHCGQICYIRAQQGIPAKGSWDA